MPDALPDPRSAELPPFEYPTNEASAFHVGGVRCELQDALEPTYGVLRADRCWVSLSGVAGGGGRRGGKTRAWRAPSGAAARWRGDWIGAVARRAAGDGDGIPEACRQLDWRRLTALLAEAGAVDRGDPIDVLRYCPAASLPGLPAP